MPRQALTSVVVAGFVLIYCGFASSQSASQCGDPPRVDDEQLKGQLAGKARMMSGFLGGAELSGTIESARRDVFSKSPEALRVRADAYLQYQVCLLVMSDNKMTTTEKINELIRVRQAFSKELK